MTVLSLMEAVGRTRTSKVDIWRAIQAGTLSAKKTDDGGFAIDPADLFAVFEINHADQRSVAEDAVSVEASESPGTSATSETTATTDITVAFSAFGTEPKGSVGLRAQTSAGGELRQNLNERWAVGSAGRNAQFAEPAAERAEVKKKAKSAALADEHIRPWWRRLVGWIRTRHGAAARKRLRERL
jgi:hypothetical protein